MAELVRHRQTKGSATGRLSLKHRAIPRLHTMRPGSISSLHYRVDRAEQHSQEDIEGSFASWGRGLTNAGLRQCLKPGPNRQLSQDKRNDDGDHDEPSVVTRCFA
jgi:hypothetical protein